MKSIRRSAKGLGINTDELVRLTTRRGSALMKARLSPAIRMDTIFAPFHWGADGRANLLTNPALDPISKMPEFKVCAVRIDKLAAASSTAMPASPFSANERNSF